ncbi:restriction endonuclease subunit S [Micromonospora sp. NBC_00898]|uniref:restriction endonuclease subunit S n=1 Tax=Micromonospora sp. NBC_00898 TaxID=2975981 RepID=UPI00386E5F12|nr:restriction endonuclease subunit S [Micromonospora sp. NBC_00898]
MLREVVGPTPSGWELARLGDLTSKIGSGATPRGGKQAYVAQGISFIRSQNVLDHRMTREGLALINADAARALQGVEVYAGDILLNITGDSVARCALVDEEFLPARVSQHVAIIRPIGRLSSVYLQKYLTHPLFKAFMLSLSDGATRPALTKAQIESFPVMVPPRPVQDAIAALLGALDDKIAVNERIADTGSELALSLFSEERWPSRTSLSSLCSLRKTQVTPSALNVSAVAHYSLPAFDNGQIPDICAPENILSAKFLIDEAGVLLSKLNPDIPRVWRVEPKVGMPAVASTEFLVLAPNPTVTAAELWAVARQPEFLSHLAARVTGTSKSHQRVRPEEVLASEVVDPRAIDEVRREQVSSLVARAGQAREENTSLAQLRDVLLPQLISGELRIKDAERSVSDAV